MDVLARFARWFGANPAAQLIAAAAVLMLVFPDTPVGVLGRLIVFAAIGIGVAWGWPSVAGWYRAMSPGYALATALAIVGVVGLVTFADVLSTSPSPDWQTGDWGPQHAVLANLMPHIPGIDMPVWNHLVSTGDAPLELYPAVTYIVTGHVAWLLGLENDLPHAFMIVATVTHLSLALTTTALAARVAPRPIAVVLGLFWLVDTGAISHGGTVGIFQWGLLHSAFAHVFSMIAALGILSALVRPRLGASVTIWIATAISTATHPAALLTATSFAVALAVVALLAADIRPRRALAALGHLVLGVALGAVVWLPGSERLLEYGQHFPNELYTAVHLLQLIMQHAMPMTAYSLIVYASYLGMLFGPWTARAEVIFISIVGLEMMLGLCDATYLALGLVPGKAVARLGAIRMMMLARPFVFAGAAWVIGTLLAAVRPAWSAAPWRRRRIAAAVLGVMALTAARVVPDYWAAESGRAESEASHFAADRQSNAALEAWATVQAAQLGAGRWGRAMFQADTHDHMHLTAKTGLPSFHLSPIPDLLLRERIESSSAENLARFNVRWVIKAGASPDLGDEASEISLGVYRVREIKNWDGQLARIEDGTGTVEVIRMTDDLVEIDVKASEPVLVALGMGYYPRWRARHATGANEPVYALPATNEGQLHVVAAWVAPGRTTFTCDGQLPSDGHGRVLSLLAALLAVASIVVWTRRRTRALRVVARVRRWLSARQRKLVGIAVPAGVLSLLVVGILARRGPAGAVLVGSSGMRATATVEARKGGGDWQTCELVSLTGIYECEDVVSVADTTANLMNDAPPSWPFITPAITLTPSLFGIEVRITRELPLGGTYWLATNRGEVRFRAGDALEQTIKPGPRAIAEIPSGTYRAEITTTLSEGLAQSIAIVRADTIVPDRTFLAAPPASAPAAVRAIH